MENILKELKTNIAIKYSKNLTVQWKDDACKTIFD